MAQGTPDSQGQRDQPEQQDGQPVASQHQIQSSLPVAAVTTRAGTADLEQAVLFPADERGPAHLRIRGRLRWCQPPILRVWGTIRL